MQLILLTVLLPSVLCQFVADMGMKPDVTFGEHNDRFDLTSFVEQQNGFLEPTSEDEYRRRHHKEIEKKKNHRRADFEEFAYHDEMESDGTGTLDFEENLNKFKAARRAKKLVNHLHGGVKNGRRNMAETKNVDKEVLLHYAVPVEMTINGYLQAPVVE